MIKGGSYTKVPLSPTWTECSVCARAAGRNANAARVARTVVEVITKNKGRKKCGEGTDGEKGE